MIDGVFSLLPILPPPLGLSGIAGGDKSDERLVGHSSRLPETPCPIEITLKGLITITILSYFINYKKNNFNLLKMQLYDEKNA